MGADDTADLDPSFQGKLDDKDTHPLIGGDLAGEQIDAYKLLEQIGEGGFGSVYLAEQTEPVRRRVALKLLKAGSDAEHIVARFEAERQTLALMDHPNIATILDAGQSSGGRPYFVMEYVQGAPINAFCDNAKLNIRDRINLIQGVCHAVQHAHQKGIIHRDIKPNNVIVTVKDGNPIPKVIDFGIAKVTASSSDDDYAYTKMHQMMGTPAYMSPEQAGGAAHAVDTRSDVFSIGALLYELLVGAPPLDNDEISKLAIIDLYQVIATRNAPTLTDRFEELGDRKTAIADSRATTISSLRQGVKGDLNWIVQKCLEKDPLRRYPTVTALDEDLRRYLENEPVSAGAPSRIYLMKKFVKRRRVEVMAGAFIVLAVTVGFAATVISMAQAQDESQRLRSTLDFFLESLAGSSTGDSPIVFPENPDLTLGEALAASQGLIDQTFEHEPELEATIRQLIGLAQLRGGEFEDAEFQLARAYEIRSDKQGETDPKTLQLLLPIAEAKSKAGDIDGATEVARRAYNEYTEAFGKDSEITRTVALWIARWLSHGYRFTSAERYFELARLDAEGASDTVDSITLAAMIESVMVHVSEGNLARAESTLRAAEPRLARIDESESALRRLFTRQIGQVLVLRGQTDEAIRYLSPDPRNPEENDDRVRARLLAWAKGKAGDAESADAAFKLLLENERKNPGTPFREIFTRLYYADVLLTLERPEEAAKQADLAIEQYDALGFPNDPDRLWGRMLAAHAYLDLERLDEAQWAYDEASQLISLFPEHKLHAPKILWAQAKLESATGERVAAKETIQRAIAESLGIYGADHELTKRMQSWRDAL